jgi:membrane peptidoglycan carboxypeptidase
MQRRGTNFANVISLLGALVATSLVLGLLGAGLMMPTVAATGALARGGVAVFDALPGDFTTNPLSQQSRILASDGSLIATPYDENRIIVPLAQIAPVMRQAQIAIEDSRFYEHGGVDPQGVGRAFLTNLRSGSTQGASTLTQQYVKITLQENALRNQDKRAAEAATAKNYTRKLQELKYAVTLEKTLTKDQILQGYLNLVYYGGQAYGVEAAARHYFGVKASQLNLQQAATLAGLVQAPSASDPIRRPAKALARRNVVLDRMHDLGLVTDKAWKTARASKIVIHTKPAQNSCALSPYPYFCEYVKKWLLEQPALGKTTAERSRRINQGGLTIQTTLNPKVQKVAQQELLAKVPAGTMVPNDVGKPTPLGAAAAVVEPGSGDVLATVQNTTYTVKSKPPAGQTALNYSVDAKYGGSGGFAFGSTAKMFAVATALNSGMPIDSTVFAPGAGPSSPASFSHDDYPPWDKCSVVRGQSYDVRNDEGSKSGTLSLTDATAFSVNTAFAWLVSKLGACKVRDMMTNLGLHQGDIGGHYISYSRKTKQSAGPAAITLGGDSVSPLTLASSYAAIASGGIFCTPSPVLAITTSDKQLLDLKKKSQCRRALSPEVANGVSQILKAVIAHGTGTGNALAGGRPAAGKTGTAGNSTPAGGTNETWFVGSTPQLTTAVWVGTPIDNHNAARMESLTIGGQTYGGELFGATIAAPIWKQIMDRSSADLSLPILDFGSPGTRVQSGDLVPIPNVAGMTVGDAMAALSGANFKPVVGTAIASTYPIGAVAGTLPAGQALRATTVVILPSAGPKPPGATKPVTPTPTRPAPTRTGRLPKCKPGGPTPCR